MSEKADSEAQEQIEFWAGFLAAKGKNDKHLLGGVVTTIMEAVNAGQVSVTVAEASLFDEEDAEAFLVTAGTAVGKPLDSMQVRHTLKWWGLVATKPTPELGRPSGHAQQISLAEVGKLPGAGAGGKDIAYGARSQASVRAPKKTVVLESDLDAVGAEDIYELAIIQGRFISGAMPSRDTAVTVVDGTGHWDGSTHAVAHNKKGGIKSLLQLKEAKVSMSDLDMYWEDASDELAQEGFMEASLAANKVLHEAQRALGCKDASVPRVISYLRDYLTRKYKGRGLPVPIDLVLVERHKASSADVSEELARMRAKEERTDAQLEGLQDAVRELKAAVAKARPPRAPGGKFEGNCFNCGKRGHRGADCPLKKESKAEEEAEQVSWPRGLKRLAKLPKFKFTQVP